MPWKLNDLSLSATSAIESVRDGSADVTLALALTRAERQQVEELAQHAGRVHEENPPLGKRLIVDTSPNGENTLLLRANAAAGQVANELVDDGWFAIEEASDDWGGTTTVNRLQLGLKRIAGLSEAQGHVSATTEFLAHDF